MFVDIYLIPLYKLRYIGNKSYDFDARFLQIQLPDFICRKPRSITQRKFWKGIHNTATYIDVLTEKY